MIEATEQMRMVEQHVDAALDDLAALLLARRPEIRRRTILRVSSIGLAEYGDRTWHRDEVALESEAIDELADGAFYLVPRRARAAGEDALAGADSVSG
ncbi:MAG: hypothetical protein JWM98_1816 [Thermoleophilia bacterium]|nr:hypothetical protein [Thermoleophilia bacterium]